MPKETFPHKKEGDILGAGHINKLNRVAKDFTSLFGGSFGMTKEGQQSNLPPFMQIPVEVINEFCDEGTGDGEDTDLVEIRPLYYDFDDKEWKINDNSGPYCLDPTLFDLDLSEEDQLIAWWNPQRAMFIPMNPGTSCDVIRFQISSMTETNVSALVDILSRTCGCEKVPQETDAGQVIVIDALECVFDELNADLIGRMGYAKYMDDPTDGCQWEVTMLCCADACDA